jgi:hypothetical protein
MPTLERDSYRKEEIAISAAHQFTCHARRRGLKVRKNPVIFAATQQSKASHSHRRQPCKELLHAPCKRIARTATHASGDPEIQPGEVAMTDTYDNDIQ